MKVLVCGGRDYTQSKRVDLVLDLVLTLNFGNVEICHGGAKGADTLADTWAESRGLPCTKFPAEWDKFGRSAGPTRNHQMLKEFKPELVVAFPGGVGTRHMIALAQAHKIKVMEIP